VTVDVDEDALLEVTVDVVDADPNVPAGEGPLEIGRKMRVSAIAIDSTVNIAPLDDEWQLLAAAGDEGRWRFRVSPTEPGEYDIIISYVTEGIGKPISYKIGRDSLVPLVVNNTNVQRLNSVGEVMEVVSDKSGEIVVLSGVFIGATSKKVRKLVRKKWRKLKRRLMRSPSESSPSPTEEPHTNPSPSTPTV